METFLFQIGDGPIHNHNVELEPLCTGEGVNDFNRRELAKKYAKLLNTVSGKTVRYYPKGKEQDAITINSL